VAFLDLCHVEEPHWQNGGHPRFGVGYQDALDFNIVTTANLEKWMAARGADPARIRIMYTGVRPAAATPDAVARQRVRAQLGIATDVPLIVWGGRICEQKRPNVLAEIFREVRDAGTNFEAVLIGDGELRPALEALLSRYQLQKRVRMLGALAHDRWLEVLQAADILVMPSRYEGISVSVLEAMATGLVPVVAHVGGMAEIIGPSEGFLIEHGPNEIAEYRAVLCDLLLAPEKRAKMGKACRTLLESKYSWAGTIDFFEKVLDDAQAAMHGRSLEVTRSFGRELATQAIEQLRVADALTGQWGRAQHGATEVTYRVGAVVDAQLVRAALMVGRVRLVRRVLASRKFQGAAHFVYRLLRNRTFS
jgi:glycosyltransferase involved in cell wall biosynthesis